MSIRAVEWALTRKEVTNSIDAFVLVTLAFHSNSIGQTTMPNPMIGKKARCSERRAKYAIAALEELGLISRTISQEGGKVRRTIILEMNRHWEAPQ